MLNLHQSAVHLLLVGGFAYFNSRKQVVQVNALTMGASRTQIAFKGPQPFENEQPLEFLHQEGRMMKTTIDSFEARGLTHFGWVSANEKLPGEAKRQPMGRFVYGKEHAFPLGSYFTMHYANVESDRDLISHSPFEQITRAALISPRELDGTIMLLARQVRWSTWEPQRLTVQIAASLVLAVLACSLPCMLTLPFFVLFRVARQHRRGGNMEAGATLEASRELIVCSRSLNDGKTTALAWASTEGIPHAVKALLDCGAINSKEGAENVKVALQASLSGEHTETSKTIISHRRCDWLMMLMPQSPTYVESKPIRHTLLSTVAAVVGEDSKLVPRQVLATRISQGPLEGCSHSFLIFRAFSGNTGCYERGVAVVSALLHAGGAAGDAARLDAPRARAE